MERLREREAAKAIDASRSANFEPFPGAISGNPQGDATIVAFMDYSCVYCRANLPALRQLLREDPRLRIVYRELPVLSEDSVTAARWALAAARQGKYQAFHDLVYAGETLSAASIQAAARAAGLDMAEAARAAGSEAVEQELQRNYALARQLNITGTPGWVIGNQVIHTGTTYEALRDAVATARKG
jgi:protein-disulfide isomerase